MTEQITNNLRGREEIKGLKKRCQFAGPPIPGSPSQALPPSPPVSAPSSPEPMMNMEQAGTSTSSGKVEKPIFTLKQMSMMVERKCEERVEQARSEYDIILQQKLSEQYDAFVKFFELQIQKRLTEAQAPSYLS